MKGGALGVMRFAGDVRRLPAHANIEEHDTEYVVHLDVADFTELELTVELVGRTIVVQGDQLETEARADETFRLHERLVESFRLPDDADADTTRVSFEHGTLELRIPRVKTEPRRLPIETAHTSAGADAPAT